MKRILLCSGVFILLFISCRENILEYEEENKLPALSTKAAIYIETQPDGASIFVKNEFSGKLTPNNFTGLDAGEYYLTLKLTGFKDSSFSVLLSEGSAPYFNIKMKRTGF